MKRTLRCGTAGMGRSRAAQRSFHVAFQARFKMKQRETEAKREKESFIKEREKALYPSVGSRFRAGGNSFSALALRALGGPQQNTGGRLMPDDLSNSTPARFDIVPIRGR
jgi:hypothetical protein